MKRNILLLVLLGLTCVFLYSQDFILLYKQNLELPISIPLEDVEYILHDNDTVQSIVTKTGTIETPVSEIDSLAFVFIVSCPDDNHPHLIDLGLPSGTKWACSNIGADGPDGFGNYYSWGETEVKSHYAWDNYAYLDENDAYLHFGEDIAGTDFDVAHVLWGGAWRMPTVDQIKELIVNCKRRQSSQNGVDGLLVTGPNGERIFLPAAGYSRDDNIGGKSSCGNYWSSTVHILNNDAFGLYFDSRGWYWGYSNRFDGRSVRPICP